MATRLKKMKINEVSLVTRPAIAREFLLYKSEDGMPEEPVVVEEPVEAPVVEEPVVVEAPVAEPEVVKAAPCAECGGEHEGVCKQVKCPECGQVIDEEEARMMKAGDMCKVCSGKLKKEAEVTKQVEEVSKALEQERLEKAAIMKELEELRKEAYLAKEAKITKEYIEKAAVELKGLPAMVPASFGPVLKAAAQKLEKSEFDTIYTALQAASAFIAKNAVLTKELGVGGEDLSADPAQQLDAIAKSYVSKDGKITYAKAYEMACMNNPQLYSEHVRQARNR